MGKHLIATLWSSTTRQYIWHLLRHKWYVIKMGIYLCVPPHRLILHDLSKFLPSEFKADRDRIFADVVYTSQSRFAKARLLHVHRNKHHWDYWCQSQYDCHGAHITMKALPMPRLYVREMVADWMSKGRVRMGRYCVIAWYRENKFKILLHPETRKYVEQLLSCVGEFMEGKS